MKGWFPALRGRRSHQVVTPVNTLLQKYGLLGQKIQTERVMRINIFQRDIKRRLRVITLSPHCSSSFIVCSSHCHISAVELASLCLIIWEWKARCLWSNDVATVQSWYVFFAFGGLALESWEVTDLRREAITSISLNQHHH